MGLFGHLVHGSTVGFSTKQSPQFVTETVACYVAGTTLHFLDTAKYSQDAAPPANFNSANSTPATTTVPIPPPMSCSNPIGAIAVYSVAAAQRLSLGSTTTTTTTTGSGRVRGNWLHLKQESALIACTERASRFIKIFVYPSMEPYEFSSLELPKSDTSLDILQLHFSKDGKYLAVLTDLPTYQIHVWDTKSGTLLCSSPTNPDPIDQLSFNPHSSKQICTSGRDGAVDFWQLEVGHRKFSLHHLAGSALRKFAWYQEENGFVESPEIQWNVQSHGWISKNRVLATTDKGFVVTYDPTGGNVHLSPGPDTLGANENAANIASLGEDLLVWGKDGVVRQVHVEDRAQIVGAFGESDFAQHPPAHIAVSPDLSVLLATSADGRMFYVDVAQARVQKIMETHTGDITGVVYLQDGKEFVTSGSDGTLRIWNRQTSTCLSQHNVGTKITAMAASSWAPCVAIGLTDGSVQVYDLGKPNTPRLLAHLLLHQGPVRQLTFDPTGKYLASYSGVHGVVLTSIGAKIFPQGTLAVEGNVSGLYWKDSTGSLESQQESMLFVLSNSTNDGSSTLQCFRVPLRSEPAPFTERDLSSAATYTTSEPLREVVVAQVTGGKELLYTFGLDRKLKLFHLATPKAGQEASVPIDLEAPIREFENHEKHFGGLTVGGHHNLLISYAADGRMTVRSFNDNAHPMLFMAHDAYYRGVLGCAVNRDCSSIVTVGGDGILKLWQWDLSTAGKNEAREVSAAVETEWKENAAAAEEAKKVIREAQEIAPIQFIDPPFSVPKKTNDDAELKQRRQKEIDDAEKQFQKNVGAIRSSLLSILARNESAAPLEKLAREEFLLDPEEKARLEEQMNKKLSALREEVNKKNFAKRVLFERLKNEFWDSMVVTGRAIKSFLPHNLTSDLLEVTNYPVRKRDPEELKMVEKVKLHRRIALARAENNTDEGVHSDAIRTGALAIVDDETEFGKLLYSPFELTTTERRVTQCVLLREMIAGLKSEFNKIFEEKAKQKRDEMVKIEDKNERIREILQELQIQENVFTPAIHDEEAPERVLEVKDSEIKAEKYVSPEELARIEEQKRQEEERLRANKDDSRERALMAMMGGRLEDRTEEEAVEKLVAPECLSKPKDELTDEEKKIIKEYEAKLQAKKEEEEKRRKALETELRKLQNYVLDLCKNFDQSLHLFMVKKLETEQRIYQMELQMIMLSQSTLMSEDDDSKERIILNKLERLQQDKAQCMREIPEIKHDLDIYRETYEAAAKKDKEIERQFRKEIAAFDFFFDGLVKLFKNREQVAQSDKASSEALDDANAEDLPDNFIRLVYSRDAPEGLPMEAWEKVVVFRDKKTSSEREVQRAYQRFAELQALVTSVLDNSERIRVETEDAVQAMNDFLAYKFHSTYNSRILFQLKQGQVEVPQAPVVTDYSEALLIDRGEVEKLNDVIVNLGKSKVEALTEMKDYRKGIHAIEWETQVFDFQAEDLVIRTRDIQLLRVTKEMQEFLRNGESRSTSEISALERRADYNIGSFTNKVNEKKADIQKIVAKMAEHQVENVELEAQLKALDFAINERRKVMDVQEKLAANNPEQKSFTKMMARRKLADLTKSQAKDIAILEAEVKKLRLKSYPMLPAAPKPTH